MRLVLFFVGNAINLAHFLAALVHLHSLPE